MQKGYNKNTHLSKIKSLCKNIFQPSSPPTRMDENKMSSSPTTPLSPASTSLSSPSYTISDFMESRDDIEKVFKYIDENGDGKISPAELQRCVQAVGDQRLSVEEAIAAVECSDSDGDGLLSLEEFERMMTGNGLSEHEKKAELRDAFIMYNDKKNEFGVITPKSLKKMMSRLGESKTIEDCKDMIKVYDVNGDGVLCFDEFVAMMR